VLKMVISGFRCSEVHGATKVASMERLWQAMDSVSASKIKSLRQNPKRKSIIHYPGIIVYSFTFSNDGDSRSSRCSYSKYKA